jgi:hypothetical protein
MPVMLLAYTAHEDGTECSETSAHKIQMPGIIQNKEYNKTFFFGRQRIPLRGHKTTGYFPHRTSKV